MLAVITYNPFPPYERGIIEINGKKALILPETFKPKSPASVLPSDSNWQMLIQHKDQLEKAVIFAGKKTSGALEIIDLACQSFHDKKKILYFVLCWHELSEKVEKLNAFGVHENQYITFKDGCLPCREDVILRGLLHDYFIDNDQNNKNHHF